MPYKDIAKRREYAALYMRKWREKNHYRLLTENRESYILNRDKCKASTRKWYEAHKAQAQKTARRAYHKNSVASKDLRMRALHYMGCECVNCGESCHACLDFHHEDPNSKAMTIGRMTANRSNWDKIQAELDKCVLLCRNCHAILHWGELADLHERRRRLRTQERAEA